MTYRDDLEAAHARADALERDNERLREEKADVELRAAAEKAELERKIAAERAELAQATQSSGSEKAALGPQTTDDSDWGAVLAGTEDTTAVQASGSALPDPAFMLAPAKPMQPVRGTAPAVGVFVLGIVVGVVGLAVSFVPVAVIGFALAALSIHRLGSR